MVVIGGRQFERIFVVETTCVWLEFHVGFILLDPID